MIWNRSLSFQLKWSLPFLTINRFLKHTHNAVWWSCMYFFKSILLIVRFFFVGLNEAFTVYCHCLSHVTITPAIMQSCGQIFCNKLPEYNCSCGGFHELNMSCAWEWDVIEVNDKRQPVIEVVATQAYWTNPWLSHVTGCSPIAAVLFTTKPRQLGKLISHLSCIW